MVYNTLISPVELLEHLDDPRWVIVDCRYSLNDPDTGRKAYLENHIPGAVYTDLEEDLSGPISPGRTGRHPLPSPEDFVRTMSRFGVGPGIQVVAYDDASGAFAARLWWMLQWMGHDMVAVLDGGWKHWEENEFPVESGPRTPIERSFAPQTRPELLVDASNVDRIREDPSWRLLDARNTERYLGLVEPIDPVAGHIPGALSAPYIENLDTTGRFKSPEALREHFAALLGDVPHERTVVYCGSGVTAAHHTLAMAHAGIGIPRLYAGSWSEWIIDPARPVATGPGEEKGTA